MTRMPWRLVATAAPPSAQQLARPGDDVAGVVGLADVLVGAGLQPADAVLHLGLGRQHQDRHRGARRRGAELASRSSTPSPSGSSTSRTTTATGSRGEGFARLGDRAAAEPAEARRLEGLRQVHADGQAVVDDEHRVAHAGTRRPHVDEELAERGADLVRAAAPARPRRAGRPRAACRRRRTSPRPARS